MSERNESPWTFSTIGTELHLVNGFGFKPHQWKESGTPIVRIQNLNNQEAVFDYVQHRVDQRFHVKNGDLLFAWSGSRGTSFGPFMWYRGDAVLNQHIFNVRSKSPTNLISYTYWWLKFLVGEIEQQAHGSAGLVHITRKELEKFRFPILDQPQQRKIARILTTVDNLIEKTEALIAKYQAIKQGMMHDLFTRGVDSSGQLRPTQEQAPDLYKQSELGWIPKEWDVEAIGDFVVSLIDGPFGSNLKTEHYVTEPAVRVVRLQNITNSGYDDSDPAFISQCHANFLSRHKVVGGDVLIASLGDDNHPPGRSCLYPRNLPPAVNKADCYRLRCNNETAVNAFVSYSLNTVFARKETKRFTQGVTLVRVNGSNMKKVRIKLPLVDEQRKIVERLRAIESTIEKQQTLEEKYRLQKTGLMQDLLSGKVRVKVDEGEKVGHV